MALFAFLIIAAPGNLAQNAAATEPSPTQVVQFLSATIDWYRQTQQEPRITTEAGDLGFAIDNRRMAEQVVRLAFDFGRQEEQQLAKQSLSQNAPPSDVGSRYENLSRSAAKADQLVEETQAELESLKRQVQTATSAKRRDLEAQIAEVQSELGLFQARQQALHNLLDFAGGASKSGGATGLRAQIEELARAVPPALSGANANDSSTARDQQVSPKPDQALAKAPPSGIWGLIGDLFRLSSKRGVLSSELKATEALDETSKQLRAPLVAHLKQLIQTGDQLTKEADTSSQAGLLQEKQQLDALTADFRRVSALLSSLGKQNIILDLYQRSLANWQTEVNSAIKERLKGLLARALVLALTLGAVFLLGELWRRAIFRYVHDLRRRYQFLLIRKIALWCGIALVLVFAFVTELGAVATFAGLITAGVAVALQNVIVSIVGYFFLIGKFGIRVGDRVQVGAVAGEVVDIGLVRFHLLELSGGITDSEPTGRVVAFSNSVVFQSTGGLFKQIPGTNFVWREITLRFSPDSDHRLIREKIQKALDSAFAEYSEILDRQRRQMQVTLSSMPPSELRPRAQLHFTTSATEAIVRYPVVMDQAAEIDERVIGDVFAAVDHDPKLKLITSEISPLKTGV